jgi:hypothetical protein
MAVHSAFGPWRKSSYSGREANCVELAWRKSSHSGRESNCVELAHAGRTVGMRDSKLGDASPILEFPAAELAAFLTAVKTGQFDPA